MVRVKKFERKTPIMSVLFAGIAFLGGKTRRKYGEIPKVGGEILAITQIIAIFTGLVIGRGLAYDE